jgi:hypothetical protein
MHALTLALSLTVFVIGAYINSHVVTAVSVIIGIAGFLGVFFKKSGPEDWIRSRWFCEIVMGGIAPFLLIYAYFFSRIIECLILLALIWLAALFAQRNSTTSQRPNGR